MAYIEWRPDGKAVEAKHHSAPCESCANASRTDEYGSSTYCNKCHNYGGKGTLRWLTWVRVPEFDAPQPPRRGGQMRRAV